MAGPYRIDYGDARDDTRMSPLVAYHSTYRRCRDSIMARGLIRSEPTMIQPYGVYVYGDDFGHPIWSRSGKGVYWGSGPNNDVWQVSYIGPLCDDPLVANGMVLLKDVPPEQVTLVTLATGHIA